VTTHLEKSGNSKVVREKSGKMEKVREKSGKVKSAEIWLFVQLKYQLLQPQLLNNLLSGLTLFFINMKQRLLTISVNTRYRVIFACVYWKSRGISCGLESGHPA